MMVYYNSVKRNEQGRLCSCKSTHTTFCTAPFTSQNNIRPFNSGQTMIPQQSAMNF
jgi:hypothetical protein